MSTIKFISVPSKRLASSINASSSTIQLNNITGWDGNDLTASDFGDVLYAVLRNDTNTAMELIELDPTTIASSSITILRRGLKFDGDLTTEVTANKLTWVKNETIVELGSNPPQLLNHTVRTIGDQTVAGVKTFSSLPATTAGNPVNDNDLARKGYVDGIVAGTFPANRIVVSGTAGATVAAGNLIYLDTSDGEWKLCDADTAATVENVLLGIAQGAGTDGNAITNGVLIRGYDGNQTGLTANAVYYAGNTAGAISNSPGTTEVTIGFSLSTTEIYFSPGFNQHITEDQQDALEGTSGTPSAANKYVTADDVSDAAASGKIVRATGTALPALSGRNLTGVAISSDTYTASGDIADRDAVYVTANDTVKALQLSTLNSTTSVSTAATDHKSPLLYRLENGKILHIGCSRNGAGNIDAFVRTLNDAETDFTNGSAYDIHTGSSRSVDACKIGTDKYLVIYQKQTTGPNADGIDAKVITVSGTTVTGGSAITLDATGALNYSVRAVRLEDDKCLVTYYQQSSGRLRAEVLTISGTTITSNTAITIKDVSLSNGQINYGLSLLDTNKALCVVSQDSTGDAYAITLTVSGTSITASAGSTVINDSPTYFNITLATISTTRALMMYHKGGASVPAYVAILTIDGDTVTKGTDLELDTYNVGEEKRDAMVVISERNAIISYYTGVTTINYRLLDITGATPVSLVDNDITVASITSVSERGQVSICKVKPSLYYIAAYEATGDSLLLFNRTADKHIGIALATISDTSTGSIGYRFAKQTGFTGLTAGSRYFIDDDGQPTTDSSLNAVPYGYALNATTMLLE